MNSAPDTNLTLLTGATGGLGPAIAHKLAAGGSDIVVTARRPGPLHELAAELEHVHDIRAHAIPADLADPMEVAALVHRTEDAAGPVDAVVHNASIEVCARLDQLTAEEVSNIIQVNLTAPIDLTRRVLPRMLARERGQIVFVSSLSGYGGTAFEAPYAATKGALLALNRSLRAEYSDKPVRFSVVSPGSVADEGMFARGQADGITVPKALKLTTAAAVADAVAAAMNDDRPEVVVYPGPIKPSLALGVMAPRTAERINERLGLAQLFRPAAEARGRA